MARPTKLDTETMQQITQAIRLGATYELACKYGGITFQTFRNWIDKGETQNAGPYREFYDAIVKAEGAAAVQWLAKIEAAASDGNWQAAAWKLERRYPKDYGRHDRLTTNVDVEDLIRKIAEETNDPIEEVRGIITPLLPERARRRSA